MYATHLSSACTALVTAGTVLKNQYGSSSGLKVTSSDCSTLTSLISAVGLSTTPCNNYYISWINNLITGTSYQVYWSFPPVFPIKPSYTYTITTGVSSTIQYLKAILHTFHFYNQER